MRNLIKKTVLKIFPELQNQSHLGRLGKVVDVSSAPTHGAKSTFENPFYSVDVQIYNADLSPTNWPILKDVPVSITGAGDVRGLASLPQAGAWVEVGFLYGSPCYPIVRGCVPCGSKMPGIDDGGQRWAEKSGQFIHMQKGGNIAVETDQSVQISAGKTNEIKGGTVNDFKAPLNWLGSEQTNLLKEVSDALQNVISALNRISTHTHTSAAVGFQNAPSDRCRELTTEIAQITTIKTKIDVITKV